MRWDLEELARQVLERYDLSAPIDPDILAARLGLRVEDGGPGCTGALLPDGAILVDDSERPDRRAFTVSHEVSHVLRESAGIADNARHEPVTNYLAAALLLPREEFERDLRRFGWDLLQLHAKHRLASFEVLARRICALRDARMFVFDKPLAGQAAKKWYSVPWGLRPSRFEQEAASESVRCGNPVEIYSGITAWPVLQHDWHRVITIASLESVACVMPA